MRKVLTAHPFQLFCVVFFKILASALWVGFALVMQEIVNAAVNVSDIQNFKVLVIRAAVFCLIIFISYFINQLLTQLYTNRCIKELRQSYSEGFLNLTYENFTQKESADYLSAMTNDINIIQDKYFSSIFLSIEDITSIITTACVIFYINTTIGFTLLGMTGILAILPLMLKRPLDNATKKYSDSLRMYTSKLKDTLLGFEIIKAFMAETVTQKELEQRIIHTRKAQNKLGIISNVSGLFSFCLSQAMSLILMIISAWMVINGHMDVGAIVAILNLSIRYFKQIQNIAVHVISPFTVSKINRSIMQVIGDGKSVKRKKKFSLYDSSVSINLSNVSFHYANNEKRVLDDINLHINPGEKWLVLGSSGSGKSTLLKLIAKMYESYEGDITINGCNYRELNSSDIAQTVTLVSQKCYLFNKSLRENIDILGENNHPKLNRVLELAQLNEVLQRLPGGVNCVIDEEVNQLSGGEKMRVNLARALYIQPQVLLLDEVTSALDRINSKLIEDMLLSLEQSTIVNVCHKFDSDNLKKYDKILILEEGKIVRIGSFEEMEHDTQLKKYSEKKDENQGDFYQKKD